MSINSIETKVTKNYKEENFPVGSWLLSKEIRSIIHVIAIYCGVPQALECFKVARKVLEEKKML